MKPRDSRALICALALLLGCRHHEEAEPEPAPLTVHVQPLARRTLDVTATVDGILGAPPGSDVTLSPQSAGRLVEIRAGEGERVRKGELLARIDPRVLAAPLRGAEATVREAETRVEASRVRVRRENALLDAGVSSKQDLEDAELTLKGAESQLETARASATAAEVQKENGELRAPFDGVVAKLFAGAGQLVDPATPVIQVVRTAELELRGAVPADVAAQLTSGAAAKVRAGGIEADGEVFAVAPSVDPSTGAVTLRIRVKNEGRLRLGQTARAEVLLARRENVLAVPEGAIVPTPTNGRALVIVSSGSKAELRAVDLGPSSGGWVEIAGGAKEGDRFVAEAPYAIPDGTPLDARGDGG